MPVARARGEEQRIGLSALKVSRDLAISGYRISLNTRFAAQIEYRMWFRWKPWPMGLASENTTTYSGSRPAVKSYLEFVLLPTSGALLTLAPPTVALLSACNWL